MFRILDASHGCMICPKCGCEEKILVDYDTPSYKEPPRELTYFAYKKINHANGMVISISSQRIYRH